MRGYMNYALDADGRKGTPKEKFKEQGCGFQAQRQGLEIHIG